MKQMEITQIPIILQTPEKENMVCGMEQGGSRVLGSRCTRSQVAPEWTVKDALILVNVIAAVEGDCSEALSSYQKWQIIAENCKALDVARTFSQCRRKWDLLLEEYKKIKQWDSQSRNDSYWALAIERRKEIGLHYNFDNDLFNAIDNLLTAQGGRSDTEPDTDTESDSDTDLEAGFDTYPEADNDNLDVIVESASNKQRPRQKRRLEVKEEIQEHEEKETNNSEEIIIAGKLLEHVELINCILQAKFTDENVAGASQTGFKRSQCDQLIACFQDVSTTLEHFRALG